MGTKEDRKIKARRERDRSAWFGLGMFGLVGWSVAIPTLIGVALGWWIDHRFPGSLFLDPDAVDHRRDSGLPQRLVLDQKGKRTRLNQPP